MIRNLSINMRFISRAALQTCPHLDGVSVSDDARLRLSIKAPICVSIGDYIILCRKHHEDVNRLFGWAGCSNDLGQWLGC